MTKRVFVKKGDIYGSLTVVKEIQSVKNLDGSNKRIILCNCSCGSTTKVGLQQLRMKNGTKSCLNCCHKGLKKNKKHGESYSRLYYIWQSMKARCFYKKSIGYSHYGGRGITVCNLWKEDYTAFRDWAKSNGYSETLTLDRLNVDGNYEPSNCRWISMKEQCQNKTNNLKFRGETAAEATRRLGSRKGLVDLRIRKGWSLQDAFNLPLQRRSKQLV
jgi:hypothetical protein